MNRTLALIGAAVVLAGVAATTAVLSWHSPSRGGAQSKPPTPQRAPVLTSLASAAKQLASENGDPRVASLEYISTTRTKYLAILGAGQVSANNDANVIAGMMVGHFTGYLAKVPPSQKLPTGRVLTFTYDPVQGRVLDWGIQSNNVTLTAIGPATSIALG